jgi:predicted NBD/HSP70 family sugar kinase
VTDNNPKKNSQRSGPALIRQANRSAILDSIRQHGAGSRSTIIKRLGLSAAGVSGVVDELLSDQLLLEGKLEASFNTQRGRPKTPLLLNPDIAYSLGLTLRPFHTQLEIEGAWCNYAGEVSVAYSRLIINNTDYHSTLYAVNEAIIELSREVPDQSRLIAAGIGIPGIATAKSIKFAPNLAFLEGDQFISSLSEIVRFPVYLQNDVNLSVISELDLVSELRQKRFAYLYISSGVGAGIATQGNQVSGHGWVGEIGHIQVPTANGGFNKLEYLLSIDGYLAQALQGLGLQKDDWGGLIKLYQQHHSLAQEVIQTYAANLFLAIQVLNAVADLDIVVIDFPSSNLFHHLEKMVNKLMSDSVLKTEVRCSSGGHHNSVRGAALNALMMSLDVLETRRRHND